MTVQELINKLSKYPNDAEIRIFDNTLQIHSAPIEEEWEPDMDDFGTCDVADIY